MPAYSRYSAPRPGTRKRRTLIASCLLGLTVGIAPEAEAQDAPGSSSREGLSSVPWRSTAPNFGVECPAQATSPARPCLFPRRSSRTDQTSSDSPILQEGAEAGLGREILLSLLVPGGSQFRTGQPRWVAYLALEAWAWLRFVDLRREGRDLRDRYRDLAWTVARRVSTGQRTDGDFEYYEALTLFRSSGAFDSDPFSAGIQPETDPDTFNGNVWSLASGLFLTDDGGPDDPGFQRALAYYRERSVTPEFAWDWVGNELQRSEYGQTIRASDERFRRSTTVVGVILANHLLSAVDAFISARLGQEEGAVRIQVLPTPEPGTGPAIIHLRWHPPGNPF